MNKCEWKDGEFWPCKKGDHETGIDYKGQWFISSIVDKKAKFCPFCGADIRKPVEVNVGMFGTFFDGMEGKGEYYSTLTKIVGSTYVCCKSIRWGHFTPGLPEGFNQDGTPKEKEDE